MLSRWRNFRHWFHQKLLLWRICNQSNHIIQSVIRYSCLFKIISTRIVHKFKNLIEIQMMHLEINCQQRSGRCKLLTDSVSIPCCFITYISPSVSIKWMQFMRPNWQCHICRDTFIFGVWFYIHKCHETIKSATIAWKTCLIYTNTRVKETIC